jgi:hypothetical protein
MSPSQYPVTVDTRPAAASNAETKRMARLYVPNFAGGL